MNQISRYTFISILMLTTTFASTFMSIAISSSPGERVDKASQQQDSTTGLTRNIERILQRSGYNNATSSVLIERLRTGDIICANNADTPVKPASNMKLFTTAAAFGILGPEYKFDTTIRYTGEIHGTTLNGNLIVVGSGDPFLVPEMMWNLTRLIRVEGIHTINGNIVLDTSNFDSNGVPTEDWNRIKMPLWYNAPTGALSFCFNAVSVRVTPGAKPGDPILVSTDPDCSYFRINNSAVTTSSQKNSLILDIREKNGRCELILKGRFPINYDIKEYYRHIDHPEKYFGCAISDYLELNSVTVKGKVLTGLTPENSILLLRHESRDLATLLRAANKFSNNFMMEQTLKVMGAQKYGGPATTAIGIQAVNEYLETAGIDLRGFDMHDGSGLSRKNRVSAKHVVDLLRHVLMHSEYTPEFLSALPIAGVDGTLKRRLKNHPGKRRIRAKTGYINGVSSLSGWIDADDGNDIIFSILLNKSKSCKEPGRKVQNQILEAILNELMQAS